MYGQTTITDGIQARQRQQPLLQRRQGREMADDQPWQVDDGQGQVAKRLPHTLSGRAGDGAVRLAGRHTGR